MARNATFVGSADAHTAVAGWLFMNRMVTPDAIATLADELFAPPPLHLDAPFFRPLSDQRLAVIVEQLESGTPDDARFAASCLGLYGSMKHAPALVRLLCSPVPEVVRSAEDALWRIWMRGDSPESTRLLMTAIRRIQAGEYAAALMDLDRLIRFEPAFAEAHFQRGLACYWLGRAQEALPAFRRALRLNPMHYGAAVSIGAMLVEHELWRIAIRYYRRAISIHPGLEAVGDAIRRIESHLRRLGERVDAFDGAAD